MNSHQKWMATVMYAIFASRIDHRKRLVYRHEKYGWVWTWAR